MWEKLLLLLLGIFIIWWLYKFIKGNPQAVSKQNISKSFFTMGLLAVGLIIFIAFLVYMLRS